MGQSKMLDELGWPEKSGLPDGLATICASSWLFLVSILLAPDEIVHYFSLKGKKIGKFSFCYFVLKQFVTPDANSDTNWHSCENLMSPRVIGLNFLFLLRGRRKERFCLIDDRKFQ